MNEVPREFKFRVSSQLKNIVGKDLIADDNIAVFELVKNSFDAHAKFVKIIFEEDKIIIWDDGKGMDKEDILNKWLFLAYSAKKEGIEDNEFDKKGFEDYRGKIGTKKYYAGAKGIGRFSTDKLGNRLILTTRKITSTDGVFYQLDFNWDKFEKNPEQLFQDIEIDHNELHDSPYAGFQHGLVLEITGLRSEWDRSRMISLKKSLEKLINPIEVGISHYSFDIEIICKNEKEADERRDKNGNYLSEREQVNGKVKNFIFETLDIKTTQIESEIKNNEIITALFDRGSLVYKIKEISSLRHLENARIKIFYLNRSAKHNFKLLMDVHSVNFGHVFLFNNGFRVYPYGEVNFDPLGIDRRKIQGQARFLGSREIVGRIEIWGNSLEEFQEKSSRDGGLKETDGKKEMDFFFFETLKKMERYVAPILWKIKSRSGEDNEELDVRSKKQIINLISRLAGSQKIELLEFGQELIDIFEENLENQSDEDFDRLLHIAQKTHNEEFESVVLGAKERYFQLLREKEEEEQRREEAEKKAQEELVKRQEAEEKARIEEEKRRSAERKAQDEEYKRLKAEEDAREARERAAQEEQRRKQKESQVRFLESVSNLEIADVLNLNHQIGIDANTIKTTLVNFQNKLARQPSITLDDAEIYITKISLATEKILAVVGFTTKTNFMAAALDTEDDIISFYRNYIYTILNQHLGSEINIQVSNADFTFVRRFKPIELTIVLDNLVSNSRKKNAKKIIIDFEKFGERLKMIYRDDGMGLDKKISDPKEIFQRGFTTTRGSGLGMFHIGNILKDMNSEIEINLAVQKGIEFTIIFSK